MQLGNMYPDFSMHDKKNILLANAIEDSKSTQAYATSGVKFSDFSYLGASEFNSRTVFKSLVSDIVLHRAQKQMRRVHAPGVIAHVKNLHSLIKTRVSQFVGDSMGVTRATLEIELPVTATRTGPIPTSIRFVHLAPKAFHNFIIRAKV